MATAESVKAKIQGLIDTANTATGNEDSTLYDAVNTLVAGYGGGGGENAQKYLAMLNGTDMPEDGGTLVIPDGVTRVPKYLYQNVFGNKVVHLVIPQGVREIGMYGFSGMGYSSGSNGTTLTLSEGLEDIGERALQNCRYGKFVHIPTTLKTIGKEGFANGHNTIDGYDKDIELPNIVTIGQAAFSAFNFAGSNVYVGKNITSIDTNAFNFKNAPTFTLTIDRAEDAIAGAPWGATNATIVWTGDS